VATFVPAKINTAFTFYVSLISQANTKIAQANPTLAAGDVKVAVDDAAPANLGTLPVVDADFTKRVKVVMSAGEMNGDNITIIFSDAAGAEWCDLTVNIQTAARQIDDLLFPNVSGRGVDIDTGGGIEVGSFQANVITATAFAVGAINAAVIATDAIGSAEFAQAAADKIWASATRDLTDKAGFALSAAGIQAIWDALTSALTTSGSIGKRLADDVDATISSRASSAALATVQSDTDDIQARLPATLDTGRMRSIAEVVSDKTGYSLTTAEEDAIVNKVFDELTAEARTAGSYGQLLKDNLNATVSSRSSQASVDNVQSDTDNIQTRLPAALVSGRMDSSVEAITAAMANKIADHMLRRTYANARASSDGDAVNFRSFLGAVGKLVNKWSISAGTLTVFQEDDTTSTAPGGTQALTGTAGADPITACDTN